MPKLELPKFDLPKVELPKVDLKKVDLPEIPEAAQKPVYAYVGATDLAVEKVRSYVADVQTKVTERVADVRSAVKGFELPQPKKLQDKATASLADLQADAKAFPARVQSGVKGRVDENVASATALYGDLAKRGEGVVVKFRTGEVAAKPAAQKPAAQKPAAKKAPAKKAPAKKAPAKKAAAKKAPAKKAAAN